LPSGSLIIEVNSGAAEVALISEGIKKMRKIEKPKKIIASI
jgi:hypothetical protein